MNADDITLPQISDSRIDEIEGLLFARIGSERAADAERRLAAAERGRARAVRRGRIWMGATAAAAFVVVAAVIAPQLTHLGGSAGSASDLITTMEGAQLPSTQDAGGAAADSFGAESLGAASDVRSTADREIVATASATVLVDDAGAAATEIVSAAESAGGYVESMSLGASGAVTDEATGDVLVDPSAPYAPSAPYVPAGGAWVTVRVPADQLTDAVAGLSEIGTVTSSQVDRRDVTTEAVDLRARVSALQASVDRLTELVAQSASTADLIAAESALAERQSELDSLQQQLTFLDNQVGMSTLSVTLVEPDPVVTADPAGFGDGIAAGWNGLVASLNGLVVAIGFLLPWAALLALVGLIAWAVRRGVRRRRSRRGAPAGEQE